MDDETDTITSALPSRKSYSLSSHHRHVEIPSQKHRNHNSLDDYNFHSVSLPHVTSNSPNAMPEFTAAGGVGPFKPPTRAAVHPTRPPAFELRPHPLRETQVGKFLRTIGCTENQLWAGGENGVRYWNIRGEDEYNVGGGYGGRVSRGDEDAAPFYESVNVSAVLCLVVDVGGMLVWSGHKDGKIRSWKMVNTGMDRDSGDGDGNDNGDGNGNGNGNGKGKGVSPFREGLSWNAHKGPVLSLTISCYGDIWSGGEGGVIKIWPWESIEKSLSLSQGEKHMAALLVERAHIDLRSQVTVNGVCNISSSDVKVILSDHAKARVWCAASLSYSLWDARTKELIKVFNVDGLVENRTEMPVPQDQQQPVEQDEIKVKFVSTSKKEKPHGFLQRSRHAIMGAADAVRRAATRGAGGLDDSKKTEAMMLTSDGSIWSGCTNGLLVQWDSNGNRLQEFHHNPTAVLCFCTHGSRLWVGYASGVVQILDLDGNLLSGWVAHSSPVIKMAISGGYVFTLGIHGGIRGWHLTSPGPIDNIMRTGLSAKELLYARKESVKILVGTWNVGQGKPNPEGLKSWFSSVVSDVGIVVVGLQEVEMGAGFLAMSAAKETVGLEGSAIGQIWQDAIGKVLEEGPLFERVGSRQLAGLLIAIWVRKNLRMHVGDLDVAAVACGLGRTIGNKGGVGLRLRVHDRIICFVNCHLAAHLEAVNRRNADFDHIYKTMVFSRQSHLLNVAAAGAASGSHPHRGNNASNGNSDEGRTDLSGADMVVFCGDFNYRLFGISYDEARDLVSQRSFDWLRERDQLRAEMKAGKVFQGMREAVIKFPPTYKFDKHVPGLGGYDSGEKKRIPAWCDRVIYRDCRAGPVSECSLNCPVLSSIQMYEACMDITDSDHKPVRCKFSVNLSRVDRSVRRKEFGDIMKTSEVKDLLREFSHVPETTVSSDRIILQNQETCSLNIGNRSDKHKAAFRITCEGQAPVNEGEETPDIRPRGCFGFPSWLEVTPACGVIDPSESMEVSVRHTEFHTLGDLVEGIPQKWWSEDTRDKAVVLAIEVQANFSMETRRHQVYVRHCYSSSKPFRMESSRTNSSRKGNNAAAQHRSDSQRHDNNSEFVDHG